MNIEDVKIDWDRYEGKDLVHVLFEKQDQLREMYKVPICDLDVPADQQQIRAMAWNVIEEAAEAIDASSHLEHLKDELADMTAFYIELLLMSGLKATDVDLTPWRKKSSDGSSFNVSPAKYEFVDFAVNLALTVNSLKNRYWRKTNVKTDKKKYIELLKETVKHFERFVEASGLSFHELMDAYLRKHEVNLFRIRSKY